LHWIHRHHASHAVSAHSARTRGDCEKRAADGLSSAQLVTPKQAIFKKRKTGWEIHGQLFEPKQGGRRPALIFIHGDRSGK